MVGCQAGNSPVWISCERPQWGERDLGGYSEQPGSSKPSLTHLLTQEALLILPYAGVTPLMSTGVNQPSLIGPGQGVTGMVLVLVVVYLSYGKVQEGQEPGSLDTVETI